MNDKWKENASTTLGYLRRIEMKMTAAGRKHSTEEDDMRQLHYVLRVKKGSRTPEGRLETPSKTQGEVLTVFCYLVDRSGVLQGPTGQILILRGIAACCTVYLRNS